jgi:drug/metabolite transporter (DMT)-like permease
MIFLTLEIILSLGLAAMVKTITDTVPFFTILLARYAFCLPLLFAYGLWQRGNRVLAISNWKTLSLRISSGMLGLFSWFGAVIYLDISLAAALSQTMPIFITILAPFVIAEKVGKHRLAAVFIGFLGVLVLIWQETQISHSSDPSFGFGVALGLASTLFASIMFLMLRQLGKSNPPVTTALWYNTAGMVVSFTLVLALGEDMSVAIAIWPFMLAIGILASFQQFFMAASHVYAPASALAPVHFLTIPAGVIMGALFFDESPPEIFYFGVAIILCANGYIIWRERQQMSNT